jgi:serine/threonine-protein kinase RIO1
MLKNDIYNINREFDYVKIKAIVLKSLEKIVKEEALKNASNIYDDVISGPEVDDNPKNIKLAAPPSPPSLKLKIRNTTQYLNWRIAILNGDKFRCQICRTSVKDDRSLRLEIHHAKTFNDICKENNICTVEQALACKELWNLNNGISICYSCHKDVED